MATETITVLFTDLVGSTERQSRLGDDANDEFRRRLFVVLRGAVAATHGEVVKTIGDAVMAVFRNSAVDAVTCAAAMHHGAAGLDDEYRVQLRVGISAGEAAEEDRDWFGTPVVEAARLEAMAEPDQTLVADVVRVLVGSRGGFAFRVIGERALKGLPVAISVAELVPDGSAPALLAALARMRVDTPTAPPREDVDAAEPSVPVSLAVSATSALTGRDAELETLMAEWQRGCTPSVARPRHVVMVSGEPGIGKTRLVAALAESVADAGGHVHYGRCDENSAAPFLPWLGVLDGLVAESPTEVFEQLREDAAELQRLCPQIAKRLDLPPAQIADLDAERLRLFGAVERILLSASRRSPTLVVLDDLHWADRSSLLLFTHLGSVDVDGRMLVVGTYRDTELERAHPLSAALADLRRLRRLQRVQVRCLDRDATASLIASRAGAAPDSGLIDAVFAETEGHPFFVEEVCAYLIETGGACVRSDRLIATEELRRIGVPEGVRDVLGRRFEALSPDSIDSLRIAAVIGPVFDVRILEQLRGADSVLNGVDEALHTGLVRERQDRFGSYEFCHALVRGALVDELSSVRRVRLHRSIAEALERVRSEPTAEDLDLLAYHYGQAAADGGIAKAVEYALLAAEQAVDRAAFDEARVYLDRGLEIVELARGDTTAAQAELLIALTELLCRTSAWDTVVDVSGRAVEVARNAGSATLFARAVRTRATWAEPSLDAEAVALVAEALAWLGGADEALQTQLRSMGIFHRAFAGELLADDDDESQTLLVDARRTGDWKALRDALCGRHWLLLGRPELDERRHVADELLELVNGHHDVFNCAYAHHLRAAVMLAASDRASYQHDVAESERIAAEFGNPTISGGAFWCGTTAALISGRFAESEQRLDTHLAQFPDNYAAYAAQLFWLRAEQGRLEEMVELFAAFVDAYAVVMPMLAFTRARIGDHAGARETLVSARADNFAKLRHDSSWPVALALLAETTVIVGDDDPAAALYCELEPYRGQLLVLNESVLCTGAADRYLAMIDSAARRNERAHAGFAAAVEIETRLEAPALLARTRFWQGKALLSDDQGEAARSLTQAAEIAETLGMPDLADGARSLLDS